MLGMTKGAHVPRIDAPTVAEHRARKQQQIIQSAAELFIDGGPEAVTPAAVAQAAGLARTSVYQYYAGTGELLGAAIEQLFAEAREQISTAMAAVGDDPHERLRAYLRVALTSTAQGRPHDPSGVMATMPTHCRVRLRELLDDMTRPLVDVLAQLGDQHPDLTAALLMGSLNSAAALIARGAERQGIEEILLGFADRAVS